MKKEFRPPPFFLLLLYLFLLLYDSPHHGKNVKDALPAFFFFFFGVKNVWVTLKNTVELQCRTNLSVLVISCMDVLRNVYEDTINGMRASTGVDLFRSGSL